ncbi:MAG TPA: sulfotransferase [Casimicrobiaceae bacterium]|nr:sulfotransferase [Casimicrobiaceae bacterium]
MVRPPLSAAKQVDFLGVGAQKAGTSALDVYLRQHPELCLPRRKEMHFFDRNRFFAVEPVDYANYHRAFDPRPPQRLLGEVTPAYIYNPNAIERIARYNPAMRLIVLLRNPITRAYSHWNMVRHRGFDNLPFIEAIKAEPERVRTNAPMLAAQYAYVDRGFYARQLERMWRHFPREQTIVLKTEELQDHPKEALSRVASFLGIEPFQKIRKTMVHAWEYPEPLREEDRRYLAEVYATEIRELERLLGWDCSEWLASA